jgi:CheY-like chemotaxis protein
LKAFSADVLEARDGRDALAYVDTTPGLVAIITDLSMPGMDGVELARKVREQPSRRGRPGAVSPEASTRSRRPWCSHP